MKEDSELKKNRKIRFVCILLLIFINTVSSWSQNGSTTTQKELLELSFVKEKSEISAGESYFNILRIKNTQNRLLSFTVSFMLPEKWTLIGGTKKSITLGPGEETALPFRVACHPDEKGGISHVIGAILNINSGQATQAKYCFVNLKAVTDFKARPITRVEYLDPDLKKSQIAISLSNRGNVDQLAYIELNSTANLRIPGEENNELIAPFFIMPGKDTVVTFDVYKVQSEESVLREYKTVKVKVSTADTSYRFSIWFKELPVRYRNPAVFKSPLDVTVNFSNLITKKFAGVFLQARGNIYFKKDRDIYYGINFYPKSPEPLKTTWILMGYRQKGLHVMAGDIGGVGISSYGKGLYGSYTLGKNIFEAAASYNPWTKSMTFGGGASTYLAETSFRVEAGYGIDKARNINTGLVFLSAGRQLFKDNNLSLSISGSNSLYTNDNIRRNGLHYIIAYQGKWDKWRYSLTHHYSSRNYIGRYSADFDINGNAEYRFNDRSVGTLQYLFTKNANDPFYDPLSTGDLDKFIRHEQIDLMYRYRISSTFQTFVGNQFTRDASNNFYESDYDEYFSVASTYFVIGARLLDHKYNNSFLARLRIGYSDIDNYYTYVNDIYLDVQPKSHYPSANLTFNFRRRYWGSLVGYYYGPYSFYQHFNFLYTNTNQASFVFSPYYERTFYDETLEFSARATYQNSLASNSERFNLNVNIQWWLKYGWSLRLSGNYFSNVRIDPGKELARTNRGVYIGLGVRKIFDIQQPRMKMYDLTVVFFNDYNGNGIKDDDEPGVRNILVSFEQVIKDSTIGNTHFSPVELVSDYGGVVVYEKIPEGEYEIDFTSLNKIQGKYLPESNTDHIIVTDNQVHYVPFRESYKVIGRIILNRDKFSNLGTVSPQNIKITATDAEGNSYSTLSNSNGSYYLSVPHKSGNYVVKVNNIFYKNFELLHNNITVEFDGMKEFNIDFIFNEKKRKINFGGESTSNVKSFNTSGNVKTFGNDVNVEIDTAAQVRYIDKLFDGLEEELENEGGTPVNTNSKPETPVTPPSEPETTTPVPEETPVEINENVVPEESTEDNNTAEEISEPATVEEPISVTEPESNENNDGPDVVVLDDDPELLPVSKITSKGITFRVKLYKFALPRFSAYTFSGIKGSVICIKDPDSEDYLYFGENLTDYKKAKAQLKAAQKENFDMAEIQAFRDGVPITLQEAGVE